MLFEGGMGYAIIQARAYATSPCGDFGSSDPKCTVPGLVSPISLWWTFIPIAVGGASELVSNGPQTQMYLLLTSGNSFVTYLVN